MTDRELMRMARTALELRCTDADGNEVDLVTPAIKALRDRLAQPEPKPVAWFIQYEYRHEFLWREPTSYERNSALEIKSLHAAPVHAIDISQERVDETKKDRHEYWCASLTQMLLCDPPKRAPCDCKPTKPKSVKDECWACGGEVCQCAKSTPKREWVGLTDEAIWLEYQQFWPFHPAAEPTLAKDIAKFAQAIEAKLKGKNNG